MRICHRMSILWLRFLGGVMTIVSSNVGSNAAIAIHFMHEKSGVGKILIYLCRPSHMRSSDNSNLSPAALRPWSIFGSFKWCVGIAIYFRMFQATIAIEFKCSSERQPWDRDLFLASATYNQQCQNWYWVLSMVIYLLLGNNNNYGDLLVLLNFH